VGKRRAISLGRRRNVGANSCARSGVGDQGGGSCEDSDPPASKPLRQSRMTQRPKGTTGLVRSQSSGVGRCLRDAWIDSIPGIRCGAPVIKGTRRQDRRAVMIGEFEIAAVQTRLITIRVGAGAFRLSQTTNFGTPPRIAKRSTWTPIQSAICSWPAAAQKYSRRPHDRDEQLHRPHFAGHQIDDDGRRR
jgi:hypothetical protein